MGLRVRRRGEVGTYISRIPASGPEFFEFFLLVSRKTVGMAYNTRVRLSLSLSQRSVWRVPLYTRARFDIIYYKITVYSEKQLRVIYTCRGTSSSQKTRRYELRYDCRAVLYSFACVVRQYCVLCDNPLTFENVRRCALINGHSCL